MVDFIIRKETNDYLKRLLEKAGAHVDKPVYNQDGSLTITVNDRIGAQLERHRALGESDDSLLFRVAARMDTAN